MAALAQVVEIRDVCDEIGKSSVLFVIDRTPDSRLKRGLRRESPRTRDSRKAFIDLRLFRFDSRFWIRTERVCKSVVGDAVQVMLVLWIFYIFTVFGMSETPSPFKYGQQKKLAIMYTSNVCITDPIYWSHFGNANARKVLSGMRTTTPNIIYLPTQEANSY